MKTFLKILGFILIIAYLELIVYKLNIHPLNEDNLVEINIDNTTVNLKIDKLSDTLNYQNLYDFIVICNIKHPEIVLKQGICESGHFNDVRCIKNNNIFGMKLAKKRPTLAIGTDSDGYAIFSCWFDAVLDYKYWQLKNADNLSETKYYNLLDTFYAKDPKYSTILKNINISKRIKK